jgi:hypothetical protein
LTKGEKEEVPFLKYGEDESSKFHFQPPSQPDPGYIPVSPRPYKK